MTEKRLYTTKEAGIYLGMAAKTLENWRPMTPRRGPRWFRLEGGDIRYDKTDLDAYIEEWKRAEEIP
jgi:predicted DNA-binding transcriptional regulator AlpA